jgi:hypothetical protein
LTRSTGAKTYFTAPARDASTRATLSNHWRSVATEPKDAEMTDNTSLRGPQDASQIAMGQAHEVRYWTEKFGVSEDALQKAVDAVGNSVDAVERHLKG